MLKKLRNLIGPSKTISYTTVHGYYDVSFVSTVISACHPYLDYITLGYGSLQSVQETLEELLADGVPLNKVRSSCW